jgi:hypothetical protein
MHAAAWSQLLPPVVGVAGGRLTLPARRWTVIWCLLLVASDAMSLSLGSHGANNLWVAYVFTPITGSVMLWTLSLWHRRPLARLALRLTIPVFAVVSIALAFWIESPGSFSVFAEPFHGTIVLLAATWTFLSRSLGASESLPRSDWFWVIIGVMLYAGTSTAIDPVSKYLWGLGREDLLSAVINLKAGVDVLAFAAIAGGMLCPLPRTPSGSSSSKPSSPWASSSAPSAWRW